MLDYLRESEKYMDIKLIIWEPHKIIWGPHSGSRPQLWEPLSYETHPSVRVYKSVFSPFFQVLAEIERTWAGMTLSYETHPSTSIPLLKADENLIETLEDNQVTQKAQPF